MPETETDPTPLSRIDLLRLAQSLGVSDADVMTRAELRAAIEKAQAPAPEPIEQPTTWVGVARRLLARVIERGLNLPDAAALVRGDTRLMAPPKAPPPVATVTLARIYAAQGHLDRAIVTIDEVLVSDPDHELARDLRAQLELRRQENLARDADAAPPAGPTEEELTPIMPEVALREAASERGTPASVSTDEPAAQELSPREALPARDVAVEPDASEVPAELVAPEFPVAVRAELVDNDSLGEAPAAASSVTHDSETPPAPSVLAFSEPELPSTFASDVAASPASEASAPHDAETVAPSAIAPGFHGSTPNGIANGVAFAAAPAAHAAASAPTPAETDAPPASDAALAAPAAEPQIHTPGLILIEAERSERYLYWELGATESPCWLHIVSHTPTARGHAERRERRFPVQQRRGAVCIQGLPASAVLRAKLSQEPEGKPIVVAGAVRARDAAFEVRFSPHPHAALDAIAQRARPALQRATPVYWDT